MMKIRKRSASWLAKSARRGFRGYPIATVALYGPTVRTRKVSTTPKATRARTARIGRAATGFTHERIH